MRQISKIGNPDLIEEKLGHKDHLAPVLLCSGHQFYSYHREEVLLRWKETNLSAEQVLFRSFKTYDGFAADIFGPY